MTPGIVALLVMTAVIWLAMWLPRRRDRLYALESVAAAARWDDIRPAVIRTRVAGRWNGRAVMIAVLPSPSEGDDNYYLRTTVSYVTGAHFIIGVSGLHPWSNVFRARLPRILSRDRAFERFMIYSDDETLARFILADPALVETLRHCTVRPDRITVESHVSEFVMRHDLARLAKLARLDWDLAARLHDRISLYPRLSKVT